jgi:putative transposase
MPDELLNETLFFTVHQARSILARLVDDYNTERPHSSLGYATPAAFAAELEKRRAGLNPPVDPPALLRDNNGWSLVATGRKAGVTSGSTMRMTVRQPSVAVRERCRAWLHAN